MKLGVYQAPSSDAERPVYARLALYDFERDEWVEGSDGDIVSQSSRNPSPEELKVRFDMESKLKRWVVHTPEVMRAAPHPVEARESNMTVAEGHQKREDRDGPMFTQTERQAQKDKQLRVFPDDYDVSEESREFYEENGETVITESEWEFNYSDEFDIDFGVHSSKN